MKNIDVNKFYKTMDQLMSDFSPPRVSTSFERKVGASLCKASELAMIYSPEAVPLFQFQPSV